MTKQELKEIEERVARIKGYENESEVYYQNDVPALITTIRKLVKQKADYKKRSRFLDCLEAAGIDSWEGYEQAQEMFGDD